MAVRRGRGPRAARPTKGRRARPARPARQAILRPADVRAAVAEKAAQMASPDVALLVAERATLASKAAALDGERFAPFRQQVAEALACLDDYAAGRCPQIPYHTVAVLATALFYFRDPVDAFPDFLPRLGAVDDALVMAIATEMVADGLARYRTWKETAAPAGPGPG